MGEHGKGADRRQHSGAGSKYGMAEAVGHSDDGGYGGKCDTYHYAGNAVDGIPIQLDRRAAEAGPLDLPTQPATATVEAAATTAVRGPRAAAAVRLQQGTCGMEASSGHRSVHRRARGIASVGKRRSSGAHRREFH